MNLLTKKNVSVFIFLSLIVLLSYGKMLSFLYTTFLGRSILLGFVLATSHCNKILGILSVSAIIIVYKFKFIKFLSQEGLTNRSHVSKKKEGFEGIDFFGKELNILKGTQSKNVVPSNVNKNTDNVLAYDGNQFTANA